MPAHPRAIEVILTLELDVAALADNLGMSEELVVDLWCMGVLSGQLDFESVMKCTEKEDWRRCRHLAVGNGVM
jgi:hypothetical protein